MNIRLYLIPGLGTRRLNRLSVAAVQMFLNQRLEKGDSVRKVQIMRTVLSAALTRAVREELIQRNVARLVELPQWQRATIRPWTADEAKQFLGAARSDPLYPAFVLSLPETGVEEVIWTAIPDALRDIQGDPFGFQPTRDDLKRAMEGQTLECEYEIDWWEGGDSGDLVLAVLLEDEADAVAASAAVDLDGFQVIRRSGMFVACGQTILGELDNGGFIYWQIVCCYPED
jgi:hypothetical protein